MAAARSGGERLGRPTRARLFEAALALIAERDFAGTTVDAIAERAGVAKGTLFYNFGSKGELFAQLLEHGTDGLAARLRAAPAGRTGLDALSAMVREQLGAMSEQPAFSKLLLSEIWRTERSWTDLLARLRRQLVGSYAEVIDAGVADGQMPAEIDVDLTAAALFGLVAVVALDWVTFTPDRPLDEVHEHLRRLVALRLPA